MIIFKKSCVICQGSGILSKGGEFIAECEKCKGKGFRKRINWGKIISILTAILCFYSVGSRTGWNFDIVVVVFQMSVVLIVGLAITYSVWKR